MEGFGRKWNYDDQKVIDQTRGKMYNHRFLDEFTEQKYIYRKTPMNQRSDLSTYDLKDWERDLQMAHLYLNVQNRKAAYFNALYIRGTQSQVQEIQNKVSQGESFHPVTNQGVCEYDRWYSATENSRLVNLYRGMRDKVDKYRVAWTMWMGLNSEDKEVQRKKLVGTFLSEMGIPQN